MIEDDTIGRDTGASPSAGLSPAPRQGEYASGRFPAWPPGFWRRILLQPEEGRLCAVLEDDAHAFRLQLEHRYGCVVAVEGEAIRHPWSVCPGALAKLQRELPGTPLIELSRRDPREDCTHLHDLALLCAAHVGDTAQALFDMKVADREDERTTATLVENGAERLTWLLEGLDIAAPGIHAGRNLRELSRWKRSLPDDEAEWATLLRRAAMVSGARRAVLPPGERAAEQGPSRLGACYNYQLPQAERSTRLAGWLRDFSPPHPEPLSTLRVSDGPHSAAGRQA